MCLGRAHASGRQLSPHLRDKDEANSYLTCHPNFNKVLVSLLYQLALFPFHGWGLTRSSVGLYNSRMPLVERKSSALGAAWPEDCGLEEMVAVLQRWILLNFRSSFQMVFIPPYLSHTALKNGISPQQLFLPSAFVCVSWVKWECVRFFLNK